MKKLLPLVICFIALLNSCKKNTDTKVVTVNINGVDYPTAVIGNRTWTTVNYQGNGGLSYLGKASNDAEFGKFYSWDEAAAISLPAGWRLPTQTDYLYLLGLAGAIKTSAYNAVYLDAEPARKLRSTSGWLFGNGDNSLGFNATAAGYCYVTNITEYYKPNENASFWTSTRFDTIPDVKTGVHSLLPYVASLRYQTEQLANVWVPREYTAMYPYDTKYRLTVRFVKDN